MVDERLIHILSDERLDYNHFKPLRKSYIVAASYRSGEYGQKLSFDVEAASAQCADDDHSGRRQLRVRTPARSCTWLCTLVPIANSNPPILMVQSAQNGRDDDLAAGPDGAWDRRVFV